MSRKQSRFIGRRVRYHPSAMGGSAATPSRRIKRESDRQWNYDDSKQSSCSVISEEKWRGVWQQRSAHHWKYAAAGIPW